MKLTGEERVRLLLGMIPYYEELQYRGNYYDNDNLNDIRAAIECADLTDLQREVVRLTFIEDGTQAEAARDLGISQKNVSKHKKNALARIVIAYEREIKNDE